jgi:hypothetical protein
MDKAYMPATSTPVMTAWQREQMTAGISGYGPASTAKMQEMLNRDAGPRPSVKDEIFQLAQYVAERSSEISSYANEKLSSISLNTPDTPPGYAQAEIATVFPPLYGVLYDLLKRIDANLSSIKYALDRAHT